MKQLGIYYSESLRTIILGYEVERKYGTQLIGRVIGHYDPYKREFPWHAFSVGYEYNNWHEGFVYVGRYTTFTTLKGYMDFLMPATTQQIDAYFKCKQAVLEYSGSYLTLESNNGMKWLARHYRKPQHN